VVGGGDGDFLLGALSWAGRGVVGSGDGGFLFGALSWAGIGVVGSGDSVFLFGALSWAVGRAPKFWKYKLQLVESSMR
jgi:hypothetical protein